MTTDYAILLQRLREFIHQEYEYQRQHFEKQWSLPLSQRVFQGYAIESLEVKELTKDNTLILTFQTNDSRFREGD